MGREKSQQASAWAKRKEEMNQHYAKKWHLVGISHLQITNKYL